MLKKKVTYEDFNGDTVTETLRFHITEAEAIEWEMSEGTGGGLAKHLERMGEEQNGKEIVRILKEFILRSYGELSDDGRHFVKTPEIRQKFESSKAFSDIFVEICQSTDSVTNFVNGIMPKSKNKKQETKKVAAVAELDTKRTEAESNQPIDEELD